MMTKPLTLKARLRKLGGYVDENPGMEYES